MKRLEIIANRSVEEEMTDAISAAVPGFRYTLVPGVMGSGRQGKRLSSATWPEENFILVSYLEDGECARARAAAEDVKARFPAEGIRVFSCPAD